MIRKDKMASGASRGLLHSPLGPLDPILLFKSALARAKRRTRFVTWRESGAYADELSAMLMILKEGDLEPHTGVELVASFFRSDGKILEACDDSNGSIGDVFRIDACELFVQYASMCRDKEWLADLLFDIQRDDDYGVRDCLIDAGSKFLPEEIIRSLIERFWKLADSETDKIEKRHWLFPIESLARQIRDAALYERTVTTFSEGEPGVDACLRIAEVNLEAGDPGTALSWLQRVPLDETFEEDQRDDLLLKVHKALGNRKEAAETAWRIFRRYRTDDTLKILTENIGPHDRTQLLEDETRLIMRSNELSYRDAHFLISLGRVEEAASYLLARSSQIDGNYYTNVLPLAELMEELGQTLTSTVLYRSLLESILARAISKYYTHGVRYLKKLDALAPRIDNWRDVENHDLYSQSLRRQHARKSAFWERYERPSGRHQ